MTYPKKVKFVIKKSYLKLSKSYVEREPFNKLCFCMIFVVALTLNSRQVGI